MILYSFAERKLIVKYMIQFNGESRLMAINGLLHDIEFNKFDFVNDTIVVSLATQMRRAEAAIKGLYSRTDVTEGVVAEYRKAWNEITGDSLNVKSYTPIHQTQLINQGHINICFPPLVQRRFTDGDIDLNLNIKPKHEWEDRGYGMSCLNGKIYVREIAGTYRVEIGNYSSMLFQQTAKEFVDNHPKMEFKICPLPFGPYRYMVCYAGMNEERCKLVAEYLYDEITKEMP